MGEGEKQKLGVVRAFARELFRRFFRPRSFRRRGGADAVGAIGEKLPDKSKKCPRPEPFAPPFFGRNDVARASAGAARRLCRSVPPWGPPRAPPASRFLRASGGARFVAERNCRCKSHSRDGLRFFCPFSPFRGRRSPFLRPLFLKSGQREGLFREK